MVTTLTLLLPLVAVTAAYPFIPCNCGLGSGEEICHHRDSKCTPLVVRPVDVPRPVLPTPKVVCAPVGGIPPLLPVGGPCDCHTSIVKPAVVPRPPCTACAGSIDISNDQLLTLSQKQQILFGGANGGLGAISSVPVQSAAPILIDDEDKTNLNPANYVPADPVSLHVAYKLAQETCDHNEDKLAFGFRSLPREIPLYIRRSGNQVPEENLFSLNGQIVELKAKKCTKSKSLDDEAREQLIQLAEEEEDEKLNAGIANNVKHISLGEIGYGLANIKDPLFINIKSTNGAPDDGLSADNKNCNDGFQPGNVIIKQIPKKEDYDFPSAFPEPCPSDEGVFIPPPPAIPPGTLFGSPYTYLSSSSSAASSANLFKKSVFLQKVGCS